MTNFLSRLSLIVISSCFLIYSGMLLMHRMDVRAQGACPNIARSALPQWRPSTTVTVYFDENYYWSDGTKTAIKRAFLNWNAANGPDANNSGVTFVGFQNGPYPNRNTAKDLFIVTKNANATDPNGGTVSNSVSGGFVAYGKMEFPTSVSLEPPSYDPEGTGLTGTAAHEIGHTFNLGDCYACSGTVMCSACGIHGPTECDNCAVNAYNAFPPTLMVCPTPTPTPTPSGRGGGGGECFGGDFCNGFAKLKPTSSARPHRLAAHLITSRLEVRPCCDFSPILIDMLGDGFSMTDAQGGVDFDFNGDTVRGRLSWTAAATDDARHSYSILCTGYRSYKNS